MKGIFLIHENSNSLPVRAIDMGYDTRPDENYDPIQLKMGIKIEMEHTNNPEISKMIAKDHLDEIQDYYTRLEKMEEEAKDEGKYKD